MGVVLAAYERHVLPWIIAAAMRSRAVRVERARTVPRASGTVLEVGIGSGLNLPFYGPAVDDVIGVDPSRRLLSMAGRRARRVGYPVRLLQGSAEELPLPDAIADTVVTTWTLCSIGEPARALRECRRVLRPGGHLVFVEHGRAPDPSVRRWQDRITPIWRRCAGGCHLNRDVPALLASAGFDVVDLDAGYGRGPRFASYLFRGVARARSTGPAARR
jgi:ubiquinone/menaquinone biosynthesis C-methylase UbiE